MSSKAGQDYTSINIPVDSFAFKSAGYSEFFEPVKSLSVIWILANIFLALLLAGVITLTLTLTHTLTHVYHLRGRLSGLSPARDGWLRQLRVQWLPIYPAAPPRW